VTIIPRFDAMRSKIRTRVGLSADPRRPSRALFSGIRRRLTLWYAAVIAVALIVGGVVLYFEVQQDLLGPINSTLANQAQTAAECWQINCENIPTFLTTPNPCPAPAENFLEPSLLVACFSPSGQLVGTYMGRREQIALAPFFRPSIAKAVSGGGSASDTVTTGNQGEFGEYASIQRYALAVRNPDGTGWLGVIVVGLPVGGQGQALSTLLDLLIVLGILTILFSIGAGLFLASRALAPAKIAYARQRDFIADASHELRTPLTMLRSTVEFVLRGKDHLAPDDIALLEDTVLETTHLTQLANNMLDLARLDSDTFHVEEEVIDMADLATEVGRWSQALAREGGVTVTVDAPEPILVLGDGSLLQQAVLVLVDNGIKYNRPGGRVDVRVSRVGHDAIIVVADTGIGVAPEHLARLGERFYRIDKARSRESGGAGLGLSIVRSVIARHNGIFDLASQPGIGTKATIRLAAISDGRLRTVEDDRSPEAEAVASGR